MNKKQIGTILLIVMTVGLVGAIIYFNALLNDKSPGAVTQIKKTKASAITYHKFLAMNTTPATDSSSSESGAQSSSSRNSSSSSMDGLSSSSESSLPLVITPTTFTAYRPATPQTSSTASTVSSTAASLPAASSVSSTTGNAIVSPTLIAYRTVTPTLIPVADTGGDVSSQSSSSSSRKSSSSSSIVPTKSIPTPTGADKQLPQTGWVQVSMIFFIVAAATVFISFLF